MSDEEPRSGSRWEPVQPDQPWSPQPSPADQLTDMQSLPGAAEADRSVAVAEAERPTTDQSYLPPASPPARASRSGRRRRAIAAAVGAGLLLIGGGAGYAIGHATAAASGAAGTFGHGRGGPDGFRDGNGAGPGGTARGGGGTGTGNTGSGNTGSGNTGTGSTGTGSST